MTSDMKITWTHKVARLWKRFIALLGGMALVSSGRAAEGPAKYVRTGGEVVMEKSLDKDGGILVLAGPVLDGIRVTFPPGALDKPVKIKLIRETGVLTLNSGSSGNVFLRIDAGQVSEFSKPVEIEVALDRGKPGKGMIQGYSIGNDGRLAPVSMKSMDRVGGKTVFSTLVPLLFTWVYTSR